MSILKIARIGHPSLLKKTNKIKDLGSDKIKKIVYDMSETMIDADGIGLAAPQVHLNHKMFIFRNPDKNIEDDKIEITALINPEIKKLTDETNDAWEGCLSIPGMLGLVSRYNKIAFEGFDINGKIIKKELEGLQARVVQHEYDHLQGILYTDKLVDSKAYGYAEEIETYWKRNEDKKK